MAEEKLQRGLSNRHVQLIALGGAIGTILRCRSNYSYDWTFYSINLYHYWIHAIYVYERSWRNHHSKYSF